MTNNLKKIQFKHFFGLYNTWQNNINSNKWENDIVFGKIWNNNNWEYKIYAGQAKVNDTSINYIYDILSNENLINIENHLRRIDSSILNINTNIDNIITRLNLVDSSINLLENEIDRIDASMNDIVIWRFIN